jgi:hypothetical protein
MHSAEDISVALPLDHIWEKMTNYWSKSSANKFDVFISTKATQRKLKDLVGKLVQIDYEAHPGVYIFERERLQNIRLHKTIGLSYFPLLRSGSWQRSLQIVVSLFLCLVGT